MDIIELSNVQRVFKVLNRHEGIRGGVRDLFSKDYKTIYAVDNISMKIESGEIVGFLGPNGAGKSTTIKMMTGILEPTAGQILVNGKEPYKNRKENAQNIGVVFGQRSQLWWSLPLKESFKVLKEIYRVPDNDYKEMLELYQSLIDISNIIDKPVRQMSLGQRTLSDILASFLHNPAVVYLDEPTIGLDVSMKGKIRELIKGLNHEKNTTVILTTHDMGDVDALCHRTVIIDKGKMLYDNDIENLRKMFGAYRTMKLCFSKDACDLTEEILTKQSDALREEIMQIFPKKEITVSAEESWIDVLINEESIPVVDVMNYVLENHKVYNIKLEEITTEKVIDRIYTGGQTSL